MQENVVNGWRPGPWFLQQAWRRAAGKAPRYEPDLKGASFDQLYAEERCPDFEHRRQLRKVMGAMRYGRMGAPGKPQFDRPADIIHRVKLYRLTGNLEYLMDAANLAELEYVEGQHPHRHIASGDGDIHTRQIN